MKNKAIKDDNRKSGKMRFNNNSFFIDATKDPLLFSNSDELRKIKNRNRKKK